MRSGADRPAISTGPALMIPAGYPRDLPSALLRAARDFGGAGVVEIGADGRETKLDFPTLLELAARILAGLRANGVRAGDPAVVHCTEPVGFFAAFWACTLGGIRPLLVAPHPAGDRTEEGRERLRKITDLLGWTVLIGRPSDLPNDLGLPVLDPDAMAGHEPTSDFHRPAADDVAVLMLSSGSTGTPKMVQLTHRGLVEFAAGTPAMLPIRPGQTTLNWLPLDRSGAFLLYHLLPVFTGCTNIHVNTDWVLANPLRWFDLMEQHRVNHSWSPNFGYRLATAAVAGEPDRHWDLSALRSLVSGGEQITVPVMSEFLRVTNRFGVVPETFVAAWGMTETVTGITFARPGLTPNVHRVRIPPTGVVEWVDQRPSAGKVAVARPGAPRVEAPGVLSLVSVGAPAPGTTVRIVAPNGAVLPEGRIGQLQVASARVTPGYLGNLEADRTAFPVGSWPARKWLATGDQGFITGGQVVITGRDSERIIMSGKLHYAHDIESVAATVVGASSGLVAACGIADEESGTDRLVVFYALTPDSVPGMDQAIRSLIQTRLGLVAQVVGVPRRDFPTTPGGKILRPLLKHRWLDGTLEHGTHPHVEPAGATPASGPTGQGPSTTPETTPYADEDPSERTTELPTVGLAWKRELQQSIPTPPQRPTLGTPTPTPPPSPTPSTPTPSTPAPPAPSTPAPPAPSTAPPAPATPPRPAQSPTPTYAPAPPRDLPDAPPAPTESPETTPSAAPSSAPAQSPESAPSTAETTHPAAPTSPFGPSPSTAPQPRPTPAEPATSEPISADPAPAQPSEPAPDATASDATAPEATSAESAPAQPTTSEPAPPDATASDASASDAPAPIDVPSAAFTADEPATTELTRITDATPPPTTYRPATPRPAAADPIGPTPLTNSAPTTNTTAPEASDTSDATHPADVDVDVPSGSDAFSRPAATTPDATDEAAATDEAGTSDDAGVTDTPRATDGTNATDSPELSNPPANANRPANADPAVDTDAADDTPGTNDAIAETALADTEANAGTAEAEADAAPGDDDVVPDRANTNATPTVDADVPSADAITTKPTAADNHSAANDESDGPEPHAPSHALTADSNEEPSEDAPLDEAHAREDESAQVEEAARDEESGRGEEGGRGEESGREEAARDDGRSEDAARDEDDAFVAGDEPAADEPDTAVAPAEASADAHGAAAVDQADVSTAQSEADDANVDATSTQDDVPADEATPAANATAPTAADATPAVDDADPRVADHDPTDGVKPADGDAGVESGDEAGRADEPETAVLRAAVGVSDAVPSDDASAIHESAADAGSADGDAGVESGDEAGRADEPETVVLRAIGDARNVVPADDETAIHESAADAELADGDSSGRADEPDAAAPGAAGDVANVLPADDETAGHEGAAVVARDESAADDDPQGRTGGGEADRSAAEDGSVLEADPADASDADPQSLAVDAASVLARDEERAHERDGAAEQVVAVDAEDVAAAGGAGGAEGTAVVVAGEAVGEGATGGEVEGVGEAEVGAEPEVVGRPIAGDAGDVPAPDSERIHQSDQAGEQEPAVSGGGVVAEPGATVADEDEAASALGGMVGEAGVADGASNAAVADGESDVAGDGDGDEVDSVVAGDEGVEEIASAVAGEEAADEAGSAVAREVGVGEVAGGDGGDEAGSDVGGSELAGRAVLGDAGDGLDSGRDDDGAGAEGFAGDGELAGAQGVVAGAGDADSAGEVRDGVDLADDGVGALGAEEAESAGDSEDAEVGAEADAEGGTSGVLDVAGLADGGGAGDVGGASGAGDVDGADDGAGRAVGVEGESAAVGVGALVAAGVGVGRAGGELEGAGGPEVAGEAVVGGARAVGGVERAGVVEPVAVVGVAGRFPGAETLEGFWENLVGGVESVRRGMPDTGDGVVAVSGVLEHVEAFDAKFFGLSDREAELMEPAQRLFLEVCHQALEHGGYAGTSDRVGVFAGSGMNLYNRQHQSRDSIATRVAYRLGLTGPAIGVQSASSSSLVAVHLACQALRSGDADLALAGAAAVQVPQATTYHPTPDSILSPSGHVRAFAADADGTVGGNGVAAVLLKRLDQALADGDTVYAVIRGTAVSNTDGNQVELVERALQRAGFDADSVSYIEADGIGSPAADAAEVKALTTALRRHTDKVGFCTIGSVKPNIGHLDSAAGMAGLIKTILMLQHRTLVPTINVTEPNPALVLDGSPFVIGTDVREWTVPLQSGGTTLRAGVSALDPSGTNAHVILEEAPRQIRRGDDGPVVLPLSAPDPDALADLVELYRTDLDHGTGHRLIDLAGTAALGRPAHRYRIAVAGGTERELLSALGSAQTTEVPRGGPGPLGYAFTGQGAARRGMAAGLAARFPVFRSVLDECDRVYHEETGGSLNELLLTPAAGTEGVWPTETAQPALFAFEVALARLWQSFGVQPALVVGHSVGEYAALCVAGALSVADGVRLTAKRGELMQRGTVPGAMVAVRADADRVREIARTAGVEVAAGNGPQSFVLTGSEVIVGQLAAQLDQLQVAWQRLDVDRAFHSSLVDPILSDFAEIVREITLKPLRTPMVSSWSGDLLESGTVLDSDYLVGQLRQPVLFGDAVEAVTAAGCRRFLELGPDAVLSPAGRRIAPNSTWIPAQRLGQDPVLATMNGLAELYEQGTEIAWAKVYADGGRVPLPTYPFRRVHHPVDPSVTVLAGPGTAVAGGDVAPRLNAFERAARAQSVVFEPPSSAAVKRIPLDPPVEPEPVEAVEAEDASPFALPAETHVIDADYLAQAGSLPGDEGSAERYRESLDVVLDLTCEVHGLDPYDLTVDHTFAELGATPASMAPVIDELRSRFEVELAPDDLFLTFTTPHKLATAVAVQTAEAEKPVGTPADDTSAGTPAGGAAAGGPSVGGAAAGDAAVEGAGAEGAEVEGAAAGGAAAGGAAVEGAVAGGAGAEGAQAGGAAVGAAHGAGVDGVGADRAGAAAGGVGFDGAEVHGEGVDGAGARGGDAAARDPRAALAVLGSGLAELAAKVDEAAAATGAAELPGSGMAALMSQQLRVAGQLVDGVTKLMREQLALLTEQPTDDQPHELAAPHTPEPAADATAEAAEPTTPTTNLAETPDASTEGASTAGTASAERASAPGEASAEGTTTPGEASAEGGSTPGSTPAEGGSTSVEASAEAASARGEASGEGGSVAGEAFAEGVRVSAAGGAIALGAGSAGGGTTDTRGTGREASAGGARGGASGGAIALGAGPAVGEGGTDEKQVEDARGSASKAGKSREGAGQGSGEVGGGAAGVARAGGKKDGDGGLVVLPGTPVVVREGGKKDADGRVAIPGTAVAVRELGDRRRDLSYWDRVLAGAQPLVLPVDRVRAPGDDAVVTVRRELDPELGAAVFTYSHERKLSPAMTMLAAVATVLGRFAAQDDVTIGSAMVRPDDAPAARPLPLRIDLSGEPDLGELTERIRDITAAAFEHAGADLSILARDPLFQILVDFEDGEDELPPQIDIRFRLTHDGDAITCTADYRSGLFDRRSAERLLAYLEEVLRRATTRPDLRLPELVLPLPSDLDALRELESDADPVGPIGRVRRDAVVAGELSGLHTLFEQQVARTPDAIAVLQGDRELTYAELDRRANAVAWQLTDLGVKPGELVAVRVARGTEMVVAVLAVLKSGAAYLPLDPGVPESRWAFMVHDAAAVALVGDDAALADRLGLRLVPVAATDGDARAKQAPPVRAAADDIAYCIYTSGSTGNPKGVVVPHRGPVNLVRHYLRTRRSLRTLQWTSFGFDVHVQEMFTTLASGAALVLIGEDDRYDPDAVVAALRDHDVQRLFMAFSPLTALLATMRRLPELPALREIVAGGEAMVLTHKVRDFLDAHPECRLFNEYGPAEASIVTTIHEVDPAEDRPSIGRPIEGVAVRLLDPALRPVPVGAVGEIHLGGAAVAQGYLGRPEETERAFVGDPGHPGARLYRSRDLGRWRVDGTLEYLGRADDQVKIRGHRVEPGETEHVLADQPGVVDAVVVAQTEPGGDTCLIGYVVLEDSDPAVLARLMLDLGKELPIYLVPADLIPIEELPLDDNGRLDRDRLPEPEWLRP
ncbi:amino acid adenylation domain-containing protein [Kribbella sp. NPDC059898]|uniref:amino acid adenylation domain-containing protein n=1 Tax=Kribbella sp. NPDC059898 TaxID=3346995 RepID=UPI00365C4BDE